MKIESRAEVKYPHIMDDGLLAYSESDIIRKQREAYRLGAEEQREEDRRIVSIAAMAIYEFLSVEDTGITKEKFVDSFAKAIFEV